MNLGQFKKTIEDLPRGAKLPYSLSEPFSWRGAYNEVAFSIERGESLREDVLEQIEKAFTGVFYGYKGGSYRYDTETQVNFEAAHPNYTAGGYTSEMIKEIKGGEKYISLEHYLVSIAFSPK